MERNNKTINVTLICRIEYGISCHISTHQTEVECVNINLPVSSEENGPCAEEIVECIESLGHQNEIK